MALVYDNTASATGGGGTSYSASHTIAAVGNSRILVAVFYGIGPSNAATKFTSVLCNGVAPTGQLTPDIEVNRYGIYGSVSVYYWLESALPNNGTPTAYNVTGNADASQWNGHLATISFTGASQGAPSAVGRNNQQDVTASSVSITTTATNSAIIDAIAIFTSSITGVTPTAGQTEVQDIGVVSSARLGLGYELVTSATGYSQTWSWTNSSTFNMSFALAIAPATASSVVNIETANIAQGTAGATVYHTLTANPHRIALVFIDDESQTQATGVSYNSIPMTQVVFSTSTVGAGNASSIWALLHSSLPTGAGSYPVAVTGMDSGASVTVVEINNAAQVIPSGSAVAHTETGAVTTTSASVTAPSGNSLAIGCAGHGQDGTPFNNPPTGTGTWTRLFSLYNPPSSAYFVGAYQAFTTAGTKTYTESVPSAWNRASQCLALFAAYSAVAHNAPFFGCNF